MEKYLVSIVVPCYNASEYIRETIDSILAQTITAIEIIVVDDGSTDDTKERILRLNDSRIVYIYQHNGGVSSARNHGLLKARGEYIVFFDADDLMPSDFLLSRVNFLMDNKVVDFVCGEVQKFTNEGFINDYYRGTSNDAIKEVLLYNEVVVTCPSNYMFRKTFIDKHALSFNEKLSSTADRFFIINSAFLGNGQFSEKLAKLCYRVSQNSMSNNFNKRLVFDNELYYKELKKYHFIPNTIKNKSLFLGNFILGASFFKVHEIKLGVKYITISFFKNPVSFLENVFKKYSK